MMMIRIRTIMMMIEASAARVLAAARASFTQPPALFLCLLAPCEGCFRELRFIALVGLAFWSGLVRRTAGRCTPHVMRHVCEGCSQSSNWKKRWSLRSRSS